MTTLTKVGTFDLDREIGYQSIAGLGFTPKLVIFWGQHYEITDPVPILPSHQTPHPAPNLTRTFGAAASPTAQWCTYAGKNKHHYAGNSQFRDDRVIVWSNPFDGRAHLDVRLSSMDTDGFSLEYILPLADEYADYVEVNYMAIGGSSFECAVGDYDNWPEDAGGHVIDINTGFKVKAMMFGNGPQQTEIAEPSAAMSISFAGGTTNSEQVSCSYYESPEKVTRSVEYLGGINPRINYGGNFLDQINTLTEMNNTGFKVTVKDKNPVWRVRSGYIALGGETSYQFGILTQPATTGTQTISTPGLMPVGAFFMSAGNDISGTTDGSAVNSGWATFNLHSQMSFGGTDSGTQRMTSHFVSDGDVDIVGATSNTLIGRYGQTGETFNSNAELGGVYSESLELNWTTVSPTLIRYPYLIIGDRPFQASRAMINIF